MRRETIGSFDGRPLNVFFSELSQAASSVVLALPFGVRHGIADRLYAALAPHCNIATWESRFVLDLEADGIDSSIDVDLHVRDLMHVAGRLDERLGRPGSGGSGSPTDVIGYCSGAGIALLAAARHPQSIRRLALVSGEFMLPPSVCRQSSFQREVDVLLPAAAASIAAARGLHEKISAGHTAPRTEFHDYISLPFSSADHLHRYGLNYLAYRRADFLTAAEAVQQRALVVAARDDLQVTPESACIIRARLPNAADVLTVEGDHYELCRGTPRMVGELMRFLSI